VEPGSALQNQSPGETRLVDLQHQALEQEGILFERESIKSVVIVLI